jgi:hypothetical protein
MKRILARALQGVWLAVLAIVPLPAQAHEVQPTIADLTIAEDGARLTLRVNLDALMSGIDLDSIAETNESEHAAAYDAMRAQPAQGLLNRAPELLAGWNALPLLEVDGQPVPLETASLTLPDNDPRYARIADWELRGTLPESARDAVVRWPDGAGTLVLRQQGVEAPFVDYVAGGTASPAFPLAGGGTGNGWRTFLGYIPVGFDHILPQGLDHILFVLGLFLLSTRLRPLLWQVSAFTLAHTVTLALGATGWVTLPGSIVEPLIAASITFVAIENILSAGLGRWRPLVVFGFGLLHGLGFASVLAEFGLHAGQFLPALIGFNIGVEIGQLTVIAIAAVLLWLAVRAARAAPLKGDALMVQETEVMFRAVSITGSVAIGLIGAWWVVERVFL